MERKEAIQSAYRLTGSGSFYDGTITCSTLGGKAVCRLVWDMKKAECDAYLEKALSGISERFAGKLLEVPVGTGFFTPPYETAASLKARLEGMYADVNVGNVKSIAWFCCRKAG